MPPLSATLILNIGGFIILAGFYTMKQSMVKTTKRFSIFLILFTLINLFSPDKLFAEDKSNIPSGQNIPKIENSPGAPNLLNGHVYPNWGPICQRYTYSVIYQDDKSRPPEYVEIYFNGQMHDMAKENPENNDYFRGVKYVYKYVPNKLGSNFYFFEASNGLAKARSNIIDSPDNGPVLFRSAFDKNEVAVVDVEKKTKVLSYELKDEWVGGVALSDDGKYLAVKTHKKIYLFDTLKPDSPLWTYEGPGESPGDVKGGIDISGDGSRIFASTGGRGILFDKESNRPLWVYKGTNQAYNAAISKDGKYMAMGTAGGVTSTIEGYKSDENTNLLIFWNEKSEVPLWQYHAIGNFHDVSLSDDGSFVTGATGCPDRRFYLFSKDSNTPIIRSEMLTRDSPVHRAKISGDGQYAAIGSEADDGAVFLFSKNSSQPVWKAPMPGRSSARALNFTSDGAYIGAATFRGDVFIFGRDSNTPISSWKVNASLGGIDIAEDGSFVATGGTDNKLHIFQKGSTEFFSIDFKEYVQEIDISANGKLVAAGTGGSVYFFEAFNDETEAIECKEIKEPPAESTVHKRERIGTDNDSGISAKKTTWLGTLFGLGSAISLFILAIYIVITKLDLITKVKFSITSKSLDLKSLAKIQSDKNINKKIIIILSVVGTVFLLLTAVSIIINNQNKKTPSLNQEGVNLDGKEESQEIGCGNGICEPNFGETKANCPQDCSAGD